MTNTRNGETINISMAMYSSTIASNTGPVPQSRAIATVTNINGCPRKYGVDAKDLSI